jgi:alginate O-acetyltransferase complex protein AlgI
MHLLASSCIFYCAFIPFYIFILLFTITIDYWAGIWIEQASDRNKRIFLIISIIANLSVLIVFKYFDFLIDNMNMLLHAFHIAARPVPFLSIILPIGLSFHTFQAMSYTIEVYRGHQKAERHFGIYALYVMFYPQLVAGPIERPQNLLHQFYEKHEFDYGNLLSGLRQMLWGLFKKVVIADRLAHFVNPVYDAPADYHAISLVLALIFFAFQVYFDFSGYSDIALGAARVMGFKLMRNFNHPFQSKSVTEFWRRWHISFSTWFSDYIYMPFVLAGREWGRYAIVAGLLITFLLSGLWHGAGWTFVMFGLLHGIAMIYEFMTKKIRGRVSKIVPSFIYGPFSQLATFSFLVFSWLFFRAQTFQVAGIFIKKIMSYDQHYFLYRYMLEFGWLSFLVSISCIAFVLIAEGFMDPELSRLDKSPRWDLIFCIATLYLIVCLGVFDQRSFIYFQF